MVMSKILFKDSEEIYRVGQKEVYSCEYMKWSLFLFSLHILNTTILRPFEMTYNSVDWEAEHLLEIPIQPLAGY